MLRLHHVILVTLLVTGCRSTDPVIGYEDPDLNIVKTWDHEVALDGVNSFVKSADAIRTRGSNTGRFCYKVYNRVDDAGSIYHRVWFNNSSPQLKLNTNYYASIFVRFANAPSQGNYIKIRLFTKAHLTGGGKKTTDVAGLPFSLYDGKWKQLGGDFKTPNTPFDSLDIYLLTEPLDVDLYMDTASLIELPDLTSNWRSVLSEQVDKVRKSDLTLRLNIGSDFTPGITNVEVRHERHDFHFGSALKALQFIRNGTLNINYRNFVLKYFNWAGFENDFKWYTMENQQGSPKFGYLDKALDILEQNNMSVRAHAIFWDRQQNMPIWSWTYQNNGLKDILEYRLQYVVEHYKKRVYEWDVDNEYLHGHYLEDMTNDLDLLYKMFSKVRGIDRHPKLCLNDYEIVRNGKVTSAVVNLAKDLLRRRAGVGCIGIQSHLRWDLPIDVEAMRKRIEITCTAGVPVSITELSITSQDEDIKADQLEKAFYVYFSQDCVHSILLWSFSDQPGLQFEEDMPLTNGPEFIPNKAGRAMIKLLTETWNSTMVIQPTTTTSTHNLRMFQGRYNLLVRNGDTLLHQENFYVSKGVPADVSITVPSQ